MLVYFARKRSLKEPVAVSSAVPEEGSKSAVSEKFPVKMMLPS